MVIAIMKSVLWLFKNLIIPEIQVGLEEDKQGKICDFCNKSDHTKDVCLKLKGYPKWLIKKPDFSSMLAAHTSGKKPI